MSNKIFEELSWLPPTPPDFNELIRKIQDQPTDQGISIRRLANHRLNINQLHKLTSLLSKLKTTNKNLAPLMPFRLGVLSDSTTTLISPSLVATGARHGILLDLLETDFGQVAQEALNAHSTINTEKLDAVLISLSFRNLPFGAVELGSIESEKKAVDQAIAFVRSLRDSIHRHSGNICILQTVVRPTEDLFGSYDKNLPGSPRRLAELFNRQLSDDVSNSNDLLFDIATIAENVGIESWNDPAQWFFGKLPFSQRFVLLYAECFARLIGSIRGNSKKCLVLDLDNTLWGGVIGDDGLKSIRLGQGNPVGEAFLQIQKMALAYKERGIVLAVCSKNEDETARLPFREHSEMLLKESDITVFQANWNDKASNIKAIAEKLNIGLDSLVFVDDNPAERAQVRQVLPDISIPELPEDPSLYTRIISAAGYFEGLSFSEEDRKRSAYYKANAARLENLESIGDYESYLRSLKMVIHFNQFDEMGRARICQLINKSNQFNLTTQRQTEESIAKIENDPNYFSLQVKLVDQFGDNGMISVVICEKKSSHLWEVTTWLMSCRVLKRRVEEAVLNEIVDSLKKLGAKTLIGVYLPTPKNKIVKEHYKQLGFTLVDEFEDGRSTWTLDLTQYKPKIIPMEVQHYS